MTNDPSAAPAENPPSVSSAGAPPVLRRRKSRSPWLLVGVIVVVVVLVGVVFGVGYTMHWFGGSNQSSTTEGACSTGITLQGNGAQFVAPLLATWTHQYNLATQNVVNYPAQGSGTGITDLTTKTVDFAITDDPLSSSQQAAIGTPVVTMPIAGGALAVIYNVPGVGTGLKLSGAVLAEIYLGKITTWNDPAIQANNTGLTLPNSPIITVHRQDSAGTTFVLTDYLSQSSPAWKAGPGKGTLVSFPSAAKQESIKGNSALLNYVSTTPDTIGYSDLTDVLIASSPPSYAAMLNPAGNFVRPSLANASSAIADKSAVTTFPSSTANWYNVSMVNAGGTSDYPLATFAYMFVYQKADLGFAPSLHKTQVLIQWLHWVLSTGQTYNTGLEYTALAADIVAINQAGISTMTYNGAAVPSCH